MTGCLVKLREIVNNLNPSEKKAAQYILTNADDIVGMPIGELAERSNVSKAAVVRLSKTLGFTGYRDFAIEIARDMSAWQSSGNEYTDIRPGDKLETIIKNVCLNNKKAIEDTLQILDYEEIRKAVDVIHKAGKMIFFGSGASAVVAMDASQKFTRIGKVCYSWADPHLQITTAANLNKDDAAVAISYSGETRDIIETAKVAKQSGAIVIAITRYGISSLGEMADIQLFLSSPENTMRSGAMASRIAQLNMVDILFSGVASIEYRTIKKYLDRTYKVAHTKKNKK
jgi:DNA-binding MurR/RpiR family transcriptional regulator